MEPEALWSRYRQDRFLIVGFERTGIAVARVFDTVGLRYRISDARPAPELLSRAAGLRVAPGDVLGGDQGSAHLAGITRIILSPGVPRAIPLVQEARRRGIPVQGDVDFVYPFIRHKKLVAITGTDGKTTTASLAGAVLSRAGTVVVAGNIGVPVFSVWEQILRCDTLVLELSSFMLEETTALRADISAIINVGEDHTDRYPTMDAYVRAKLAIVEHAREGDVFLHNLDDPRLSSLGQERVRVRTFSRLDRGADYHFDGRAFHLGGARLEYARCRLRGVQNVENILVAGAIGCEAGLEPREVVAAIASFEGLPHRFQGLGTHDGVQVINDSKATTVHAVESALANFERGVVLIVGGREKGLDFSHLRRHASRIKHCICYGEAGPKLAGVLSGLGPECVSGFDDAVERAVVRSGPGDVLLLSPGCVSWDQFPSYEARGVAFEQVAVGLLRMRAARASSLRMDSRRVRPGDAFVAIEGQRTDGHRYLRAAIDGGARLVFHDRGRGLEAVPAGVQQVAVPEPRGFAMRLAAACNGHPSRRMKVMAITGTNGKTTCSVVLERLLLGLGMNPGVINTLGIRYGDVRLQLDNVVPEPLVLQGVLRDMELSGTDSVVLEASSYALSVGRLHGVELDGAVLTNVTRDHLDVHGDMESYLEAKLRLFEVLRASSKPAKRSGLWGECAFLERIERRAAEAGGTCEIFGLHEGAATLRASNVRCDLDGSWFDLVHGSRRLEGLRTSLIGEFNVRNILAALSIAIGCAEEREQSVRRWLSEAIGDLQVPGRLERVENQRGATILVDYAHTDDALRTVLTTLRGLPHRRLVTVFGCGGERDRGKRPLMGKVASELSDEVIVTSDNPRNEEPGSILRDIEAGVVRGACEWAVIAERSEAIGHAVGGLGPGDILLVAGKGHERVQIVGKQARSFSDQDIIREHLGQELGRT